jgi:hypothetical protein
MRLHRLAIPLALISLGLLGCSGPELEEDASMGGKGRFGLVDVSYEHDWATEGSGEVLLTTTAQFVRYSALDREQVARLLALPLDPAADLPSVDQCKIYDLSVDLVAEEAMESESGSIELLEAGDLRIQTEDHTVTLSPRHFPWLLPFIYGVMYGEAQTGAVERVGAVKATADGGEAVGAFSAQVGSPELPRLARVGADAPSGLVVVPRGQPLPLRWSGTLLDEGAEFPDDVVYTELRYTKGKRDWALRCRMRDDGAFDLPGGLLTEGSGKATLEVARLRRSFFTAGGLERGELRVSVRDKVTIQLQ